MQSVLLTGGSGLLALGWAAAARTRARIVLGLHERAVSPPGVETRVLTLDDPDAVARAIEETRADVVVHAAAMTSVEACEANPGLAQHVNVALAGHVAAACARAGARLVHVSSDQLFDGTRSMVDEAERVAPVNVYGRTKADGETAVRDAHPSALIVRTNFYGWGTAYRPSFSDFILRALRAGTPITLFADVFYTPILIETLVDAIEALLARDETGLFHVTGDTRLSKLDFGRMAADVFGLDQRLITPGRYASGGRAVRRPLDMSLSNARLRRTLGRAIGGPADHLPQLRAQEHAGAAREMVSL